MSILQLHQHSVEKTVHDWVKLGAAAPEKSVRLAGVLYLSDSGWLLLNVPNALVRGAFAALDEPGVELPLRDGRLNAHITVMSPDDIELIGGPEKLIKDRGHVFHYTLGPVESVAPEGWADMSKCWFIKVDSPELRQLRKTHGLAPLPKDNEHDFHITVAVRRKKVLQDNEVSKSSEDMQMATIQELAEKLSAVLKPPASERVLYHGTLPSRVDAILKGGLDPHRMGTGVLSGMPEELRVPRIFLTKNKGEAEDWAATGASQDRWEATKGQWLLSRIMNQFKHEPGPVVEARLPANFPVKQQLDLFGGDDEYESEQHIPAKYLRRIDNLAAKMSEYLRHA